MFTNEDESWHDIIIATKLKMAALKLRGNLKALVQISFAVCRISYETSAKLRAFIDWLILSDNIIST
jgi:hypothetical protein